LILARRTYLRKAGFEIFRYPIASSVVETTSFSNRSIELSGFVLILMYCKIYAEKIREDVLFYNYWISKVFLSMLENS